MIDPVLEAMRERVEQFERLNEFLRITERLKSDEINGVRETPTPVDIVREED